MTDLRQLPFDFASRPALSCKDFLISPSNKAAFETLMAPTGPARRIALSGPAGAGKTHLAAIWAEANDALVLPVGVLNEEVVSRLTMARAIVIEDADRIDEAAHESRNGLETNLFHAMNLTAAEDVGLLITGRTPPARWPIEVPDLASRLAAMHHVAIQGPDDALLSSILDKLFTDRQLSVGPDVVKYLVRRMARTYAAAEQAVERLDQVSLAGRRPITRWLAMELYGSGDDVLADDGDE